MGTSAMHAESGGQPRTRRRARRPDGFVFLVVLFLMVVAVATIGWSIARTRAQAAVVALQVEEYQLHHQTLGVRAIVADWLSNNEVRNALPLLARLDEIIHVVELPTGELISLYVEDGQASALGRLDIQLTERQREMQLALLANLPADDPRFIRGVGPVQISMHGAPPEVVLAATGGDHRLARLFFELRERPDLNQAQFLSAVRNAGYQGSEGNDLWGFFTRNPVLWRVNAEVVTDRHLRRYTLLAKTDGAIPEILEWRVLPDGAEFQARLAPAEPPGSGGATAGGSPRRR